MTAQTEIEALSIAKETAQEDALAKTVTTTRDQKNMEFKPIVYSDEELDVMRQVQRKLIQDHEVDPSHIAPRILALTTIINKLRVDEAVKGFLKFQDALKMVDIHGFEEEVTGNVEEYIGRCYEPCGVDAEGRRVMWIKGKQTPSPHEEKDWVQASVLYWMAIHADDISLRDGIQFVLDVTNKPKDEHGNSQKLQKINQCYPLRPQAILIAGTNVTSRLFINGLIKIASIFAKTKVLKRIKFVSVDDAMNTLSQEDCPQYLGGGGGGIDNVVDWVKERLNNFPIPEL